MTNVNSPVNIDSRKNLDMRPGDTVRVFQKIQEKGKTRLQAFEGMVLARKHGTEAGATFTVRRNTGGYGVEKIFPLYSPNIDRIEVIKRSKIRRSKLYYIRDQAIKQAKKRLRMMFVDFTTVEDEKKNEEEVVEGEVKDEVENSEAPEIVEESSVETPVEDTETEDKK